MTYRPLQQNKDNNLEWLGGDFYCNERGAKWKSNLLHFVQAKVQNSNRFAH